MAGEAAAAAAEVETALDTPVDPTAAAFFDVDNTIMQGASIFHLARGLHRREFFTTRDILGAAWKQAYFRLVGVEDPEHVAEARNSALGFIAGHTVSELEALGEEIFDEGMAHRIWPGTRALAQMHLDQGQRVWLVTAAPDRDRPDHRPPARPHRRPGHGRRARGRRLHRPPRRRHAARPGQGGGGQGARRARGARPGRCSAYSDSANDLPMLSLVGDPCAINPDARLRAHARPQGWRIRDYRTGRKAARAGLVGRRGRRRGQRGGRRRRHACAADATTERLDRSSDAIRARTVHNAGDLHLLLGRSRQGPIWGGSSTTPCGVHTDIERGLDALRRAVLLALAAPVARAGRRPRPARRGRHSVGCSEAADDARRTPARGAGGAGGDVSATPTWPPPPRTTRPSAARLIALVELARGGDTEAFGLLYDHYQPRSTASSTTGPARWRWPRTSPRRPSSGRCAA